MRVMVADDEELVREYVTLVVTLAGHEIVTAASGFEAIRRAKCDQPDLILLDGIMPEMQGLEVARYLRGQKLARQPYLIAMSARPATEAEAGRMENNERM